MRAFALICLAIAALFLGCVKRPEPLSSRAVAVIVKTPNLSVSQSGFVYELPNDEYRLQIYATGQAALELSVGEKICKGAFCLSAAEFNKRYFSENYPANFLRDILGGRTIAALENDVIASGANGFAQTATIDGKYDIRYESARDVQRFKDAINSVLIVIRRAD
ncbi:MAG: hypothetical protein LBI57_07395 [Helicobacteraceae bacterium]|jgi:hypothetical protein|nr:hypothetical protein [Helicobacteraceae bacterium]